MEIDSGAGLDVGQQRLLVPQQNQLGALPGLKRGGALMNEQADLVKEVLGEAGAVGWWGTGHDCLLGRILVAGLILFPPAYGLTPHLQPWSYL